MEENELPELTEDQIRQFRTDELDIMTGRGKTFEIAKPAWLQKISKTKKFTFRIRPLPYWTQVELVRLYHKVEYDERAIKAHGSKEINRLILENGKDAGMIVATAVLVKPWKVWLLGRILSRFFFVNMTPRLFMDILGKIYSMQDHFSFAASFKSMSKLVNQLMKTPDLEEKNQAV